MVSLFATGAALGLSAAVPIGPVNLTIMRRGLAGGFWPAFLVGLGAATIDMLYSAGFLFGFSALQDPSLMKPLGIVGAIVLLVLGAMTMRDAFRDGPVAKAAPLPACDPADLPEGAACPLPQTDAEGPLSGQWGAYLTGLSMTASNPITLAFWASVGASAAQFDLATLAARANLMAGVLVGALAWVVFFAALLHKTRHMFGDRARRGLTFAGGAGIAIFGVRLLILG